MPDDVRELLSLDALDERIAIVGTAVNYRVEKSAFHVQEAT